MNALERIVLALAFTLWIGTVSAMIVGIIGDLDKVIKRQKEIEKLLKKKQ